MAIEVVVESGAPQDGRLGLRLSSRDRRARINGIKLHDACTHQRKRLDSRGMPGKVQDIRACDLVDTSVNRRLHTFIGEILRISGVTIVEFKGCEPRRRIAKAR